jgi:hypothetical protein
MLHGRCDPLMAGPEVVPHATQGGENDHGPTPRLRARRRRDQRPALRPPGIWQNEANCEKPSSRGASPRHRRPRAARSRSVARAQVPRPAIWQNEANANWQNEANANWQNEANANRQNEANVIWPNEANAKPFASKQPPGILAERSQWRRSPWLLGHRRSHHPETSALSFLPMFNVLDRAR